MFKPNLIPNNPKDGSFTIEKRNKVIAKNGGIDQYIIHHKKDGVRLEAGMNTETVQSRSLGVPGSILVQERFQLFHNECRRLNMIVEGEFYSHGMKFNEIFRFYSNRDITRPEVQKKYAKELEANGEKFEEDYDGRDIEFLTTFHKDLKFWIFDGILLDCPEVEGFEARMAEVMYRLRQMDMRVFDNIVIPTPLQFSDTEIMDRYYDSILKDGWEGLVLTHKDHKYKFGRNSLTQGTLLKIKDEVNIWDGQILDVVEGDKAIEGAERVIDNFGNSSFSGKKEFREPNGKAKGFKVEFEGKGTFTVGLRGFTDPMKKELLENKEAYIGRWFKYKGMPPVKTFPRSVFFECWRDSK